MKEKVTTFIIGFLVGAIIVAAFFLIYENAGTEKNDNQINNMQQMGPAGVEMPQMMPNGEMKSGIKGKMKGGKNETDLQNNKQVPPDILENEENTMPKIQDNSQET